MTDISELFSTLNDNVKIAVSGKVNMGKMEICLIGINDEGERKVLRRDKVVQGDFSLSYEIDPISYAVYSGAKSFVLSAEPDDGCDALIENVSFCENEITQSTTENEEADLTPDKTYPVPKKSLFVGNSILLGMDMSYGMCSDAPTSDYFYHVTSYIKQKRPDAEFLKLYGSYYEHSESMEAFWDWYNSQNQYTLAPSCESFTEDLDLIVIQLGDNINTEMKYETFCKSGDVLIAKIKERAPNARILWVHGWFGRAHINSEIASLCRRHGLTRVDISGIRDLEGEAHDLEKYIKKDGSSDVIRDTWKTHPGNRGMEKIAEKIIAALGF